MSGTDHGKSAPAMPQPAMVLVEPQMGENIGAAARAMWNFSLQRLRLVNPRDGWPNTRAKAMASGAGRVLDNVTIWPDTGAAIADLNFVFATTARNRDLTNQIMSPQGAMQHAAGLISQGQNVGILFGPERAGLNNADIVCANALISVPVNPAFGSLNLAQSVLILAYEWQRRKETPASEMVMPGKTRLAKAIEIQRLSQALEERLQAKGFFWPDHKASSMALTLRNLMSRLPLTDADVRTLHGVFRALDDGPNSAGRKKS